MDLKILSKIKEPIFYVTNDVSRGIGLESLLPNYHIVCLDDHPLVDYLLETGISVFCLERSLGRKNAIARRSGNVLEHSLVLEFIKKKSLGSTPNILFFKPQKKIEILAQKNKFNLLGNSAEINEKFEDKVSFFKICQQKKIKVPQGEIGLISALKYHELVGKYGKPLVIQSGRGWAGNSTYFVSSEEEFIKLSGKLRFLKVKVGAFIRGKTILNNAVIFNNQILVSKPALQVRADDVLTSNMGGTGGRQWPAGVSPEIETEIEKITKKIGEIMSDCGYKGFFGLDFLVDDLTGEVYLTENNARLTASVPFYTKCELMAGAFPLLAFHILSFLDGFRNGYHPASFVAGEIIARNTFDQCVEINGNLDIGVYNNTDLSFKRPAYFLDSKIEGELWLTGASLGRKVNPGIELIKLNSFSEVCDKNGKLKDEYRQVIRKALEKLNLRKC